jgi:hypothetical protein
MFDVIVAMRALPMRTRDIGIRFGKNKYKHTSKLWVSKFLGLRRLTEREWALVEEYPELTVDKVYPISCMPTGSVRWLRLNEVIAAEARRRSKKAFQEYLRTVDDMVLLALVESDSIIRRIIEERLNDIIDAAQSKLELIGGRRRSK